MTSSILVFGSNRQGRHGKGAALEALQKYGAVHGQAEGRQGNSYGIVTKELRKDCKPVDLWDVAQGIEKFLGYASKHPELDFIVSPIGCGLAGFKSFQIAPLFAKAPWNVKLPVEFLACLTSNLFVDGGVIGKNPSKQGGTWAWCLVENEGIVRQGSGILVPDDFEGKPVTNNQTELYAAYRGLLGAGKGWDGTIHTDSRVTMLRLTSSTKFDGIPTWFSTRILEMRRNRKWKVKLVKGHPSMDDLASGKDNQGRPVSKWNQWCDKECNRLAKKTQT